LRLVADAHLDRLDKIADDPTVVSFLLHPEAAPPSSQAWNEMTRRLIRETRNLERGESVLSIYDREGHLLVSTAAGSPETKDLAWQWRVPVVRPMVVGASYSENEGRFRAEMVAPVHAPDSLSRIGFVSESLDINQLLKFALDMGIAGSPAADAGDVYQVVYLDVDGEAVAVSLSDGNVGRDILRTGPVDPALRNLLAVPGASPTNALFMGSYESHDDPGSVFLGYSRIFKDVPIYLAVYRPASIVFWSINRWAAIGVTACFLVVAVLCLNAYRHVHNNIVRPVLLLNEGAQIIGQGDLELKLKIGTGDELEELASSFNKMAFALNRNIRQLEESEEKYRSLVTSMRDGLFQTDPDGVIGFLNPAGVEVLGFRATSQALGVNLRDSFLNKSDFARLWKELEQKAFIERTRVWMRRQDDRAICVELAANLLYDDEGKRLGIEGTIRDVTKSVQLEQAARERAERLSAINQIANVINSSLEAGRLYESLAAEVKKLVGFDYASISLADEEGASFETRSLWPEQGARPGAVSTLEDKYSCPAWVAREQRCLLMHNLTTEPGAHFRHQFPEDMRSCLCVPLYAAKQITGTLNLASRQLRAFQERDVEVLDQVAPHVAVALRNAQLLENLQVSLEEVTQAREKLHAANEELKTLDEMKTNLLSNVSHELRTPLVSVMGYTDMILNEKAGPISDVQKEYLSISMRNVEKLVTLIENLLDFSRLHQGAETLVFDTLDLVDCARSSVQMIKPVADSRQISLKVEAPEEPVLIEGDRGKLGQVFNNLLANAVKFNKDGGTVTVAIRPRDDTVEAEVCDTGIGIPEEALDKVFTRFYQYDSSSTRKYGGTGIGLSIAQDIVRRHGSRIIVESIVGKGATFRFNLPVKVPARAPEGGRSQMPQPPETRVLIELVTQDRALMSQVRGLLEPEGMDLIYAVSSDNAVSLAQKYAPDCVMIDMEFNGNGSTLLQALVAGPSTASLPIVLLTNDDRVYDAYRRVVAGRVKRSFRKSSLLSGIRYALNQGGGADRFGNKVLCVDDDPEVLTLMRRCIEGEDYQVEQCKSGEEALRLAASHDYGLVLLDIAMPGLDGWETCRRIKADPELTGIRVYMVTAKPIDQNTLRDQQAGADGYLLKPFRPEDLLELLRGSQAVKSAEKA
jgi:PAS domain S-box-containing protein